MAPVIEIQDHYTEAKDTLADVEFMTTPDDIDHQGTRALVAIGHALLALVDAVEASRRPIEGES